MINFLSRKFRRDEKGVVSIELALLASILLTLSIPVVDYGLAALHGVKVKNAIRAGLQYASVRKPNPGDTDVNGTIQPYLNTITAAMTSTGPPLSRVRGGSSGRILSATMFCRCDEGAEVICFSSDGSDIDCASGEQNRTYLRVQFEDEYEFLFPWLGMSDTITLGDVQEVRLN